jgi:hypothetical protein
MTGSPGPVFANPMAGAEFAPCRHLSRRSQADMTHKDAAVLSAYDVLASQKSGWSTIQLTAASTPTECVRRTAVCACGSV